MGWLNRRVNFSRRVGALQPNRSVVQSLNYAFEGIIHVLATQRNMRIHFFFAAVAMALCVIYGVRRVEFAIVMFAATFVIVAEMINTAIESAVDVATKKYSPLAKVAKDVSAGAVLLAAVNAIIIAYLVFGWRLGDTSTAMIVSIRNAPVHLTVVVLTLTFFGTIALKVISGSRGTSMRGGWPSGHAAIAFAIWMTITMVAANFVYGPLLSVLAFLLALLVAHTRVESGVHTTGEVVAGAVVGSVISLVIFQAVILVE